MNWKCFTHHPLSSLLPLSPSARVAVCSVPIAALTASIYITLLYLRRAPAPARARTVFALPIHPANRPLSCTRWCPAWTYGNIYRWRKLLLYMYVCVCARMYIDTHTDSREDTRGRIIREETSTYLDSSGALIDSHRFTLTMRKEKPFQGGRGARGRGESYFQLSLLRKEREFFVETFCMNNNGQIESPKSESSDRYSFIRNIFLKNEKRVMRCSRVADAIEFSMQTEDINKRCR